MIIRNIHRAQTCGCVEPFARHGGLAIDRFFLSALVASIFVFWNHPVGDLATRTTHVLHRYHWSVMTVSYPPGESIKKKKSTENKEIEMAAHSLHVFMDVVCFDNGKVYARSGYRIHFSPSSIPPVMEAPLPGLQTINRAQIHALIRAIKETSRLPHKSILLQTRSEFLVCLFVSLAQA